MIRYLKYLVIAALLLFITLYIYKFNKFQTLKNIGSIQTNIEKLSFENYLIKDEIKKVVSDTFVNYDILVGNIHSFEKSLEKIEQSKELLRKIHIESQVQKVKRLLEKEKEVIEKIVQTSAVMKSSFLYLPYLQKEILHHIDRDKKILEHLEWIIEILTYRLYLKESMKNDGFATSITYLQKYTKKYPMLNNFIMHAKIIYNSIVKITPLVQIFDRYHQAIQYSIDVMKKKIVLYQERYKNTSMMIETILTLFLLFFALLILYLVYKEEKFEKELKRAAETDYLTHLPNRYKLLRDFTKMQQKGKFFVVRFDFDDFSSINDNFGSMAGDEVLKFFAKKLQHFCPQRSYRVTSDEFVVLCTMQKEKIIRLYTHLRQEITKNCRYYATISAAAIEVDRSMTYDELVNKLLACLYSAKKQGGDRILFFDPEDIFIREYLQMSKKIVVVRKELEDALRDDAFRLYFQPIMHIATKKIEKYEVLIRWQKGSSLLQPAEFIQMAEKLNLIGKITRYVIEKSFVVVQKYKVPLSINLSALDLLNGGLLEFIQTRIDAKYRSYITFEITETAVVQDFQKGIQFLQKLKSMGFFIAIDDFGVGYSSLQYITMIPADFIKIDGAFIKNIHKDKKAQDFLASLHHLIKTMGTITVAEYVENRDILDKLTAIGIDYAQGYYIGKPLPVLKGMEHDKNSKRV